MIRLFYLLLSISLFGKSVAQTPVDSVETINASFVYNEDKTEEDVKPVFDGVLNTKLNAILVEDTFYHFVQTWNNNLKYTSNYRNDLSRLKDTIWLCVLEEQYSEFVIPTPGVVTSRYGYRSGRNHTGIDLDLETGDTVYSCWSGKIRYAKFNNGGYGNLVIIRHYNGLETFYGHMSKILVDPNQDVEAGDPIGLGGNTGRSFGSHLHFEVRFFDAPINPEEIIDFEKGECKDENLMVHKGLFKPGAKPTDQVARVKNESYSVVNNSNRVYYKVKSGDTLSAIAARNKTTLSKLCELNGIRPTTTLQIGRSLRVR